MSPATAEEARCSEKAAQRRLLREGSVSIGLRTVTYLEAGDLEGPPSTRLEARLCDVAAQINGLRFVCADRPGVGASDPQPGRSFKVWAESLLHLADLFAAQRFAVTGWSEGFIAVSHANEILATATKDLAL